MNPPPSQSDDTVWTTQAAAEYLADKLDGGVRYWDQFLVNNRRPERRPPFRIPVQKWEGTVVYREADLKAFIDFEQTRRQSKLASDGRTAQLLHAYGINNPNGGAFGRRLDCQLTLQIGPSGPFMQLLIGDPLLVYCVPPDQVRELARELNETVARLERILSPPSPEKD